MTAPNPVTHRFAWGNNPKRATLKGRRCRKIASGKMGSVLVEFEGGQREIISRRALRGLPVVVEQHTPQEGKK